MLWLLDADLGDEQHKKEPTQKELRELTGISQPTTSRILGRLESLGLVESPNKGGRLRRWSIPNAAALRAHVHGEDSKDPGTVDFWKALALVDHSMTLLENAHQALAKARAQMWGDDR
tara:strand:+ start:121 stop:474 length:354 start_codon:yes stop_codon:yes gene_type:complete